jgi:hypothetical protein
MDLNGIKMRIIALDELMKACVDIGRSSEQPEIRAFAKALFEAARERHEFLAATRVDGDSNGHI